MSSEPSFPPASAEGSPANPRQASRWVVAAATADASVLAGHLQCPAPVASLLATRGIASAEAARRFFAPQLSDLHDPGLMLGIAAAVARIQRAVTRGEHILIYGDYDVDGTTATVLLKAAIERIAPAGRVRPVEYHVPHRLREGYGMQDERLTQAAAAGVSLVISVDTGIRAFAAARQAHSLGLDLIVTDHHLPDGAQGVPEAVAVINPAQPGCPYPDKNLCGAAVAFKLAHALLAAHAKHSPQAEAQKHRLQAVLLPSFLKLVALATIADSVPLTGENRTIACLGLAALQNPVQPGLRALMQVAELPPDRAPTAHEVGFRLAPRINAAGRMDVASDVVELLLTRDPKRAAELAQKLDSLNQARRATEAAALEAIDLQLLTLGAAAECLVLDHPSWHRGVLGILAARVVERTGRPALVLTSDADGAYGSGRSVDGFHLLDALTAVHAPAIESEQALFSRFGGHAHAVGFSLPADRVVHLRERMRHYSASRLNLEMLTPQLAIDLELSPDDLTAELFTWVERCAPFGIGNPEPLFLIRKLTLEAPPRIIKERHVCLTLAHSIDAKPLSAMGWSRSPQSRTPPWNQRVETLQAGSQIDVVCRLRHNRHPQYGGFELELADLRLAGS